MKKYLGIALLFSFSFFLNPTFAIETTKIKVTSYEILKRHNIISIILYGDESLFGNDTGQIGNIMFSHSKRRTSLNSHYGYSLYYDLSEYQSVRELLRNEIIFIETQDQNPSITYLSTERIFPETKETQDSIENEDSVANENFVEDIVTAGF